MEYSPETIEYIKRYIKVFDIGREFSVSDKESRDKLVALSSSHAEDCKEAWRSNDYYNDEISAKTSVIEELMNIICDLDRRLESAEDELSHPERRSPDYDPWDL